MGHGLTMLYAHDLPRALTDCDMLSDGWDRESCYGGAFMESVINATAPHHPATMLAAHSHHHMAATTFKALDPADPLYPCSIMADSLPARLLSDADVRHAESEERYRRCGEVL